MTIVLVHGNPETAAIWGPLIDRLGRADVVTLSPPGFGAPVPAGFGATSDDYVAWLIAEIEAMAQPIDLVGHDWGGGHVARLACARPDLVRSWCTDIAGCFDSGYVWHDFAQIWQTPVAGEENVAAAIASPPRERAALYESLGMTSEIALSVAGAYDEAMGRCILALYRSAAQPAMIRWGEELDKARGKPGLVIIPTEDHFTGGEAAARRSAERAGASIASLDGLGHWWMLQDPDRGAAALTEFWSTLR